MRRKTNFCIKQGVKQGCPLSPVIFNIFIEYTIRKIVESGKVEVKFNGRLYDLLDLQMILPQYRIAQTA